MEKVRKFGNFTIGCRMTQHKQKSKFDQDQTSSSWEKCKKVKKILKLYNWLQNAIAWNKNQSLIKIRPVVPEKNGKKWEICETLQMAAEWHSINKNQRFIKMKPVVPYKNGKSEKIWKLYNWL